MFKNIFKKFQNYIFPALILLLVGIIAWKNYEPNTILSGWDALHPEFNFGLALKQGISGVWREAQGVGAVAAHSHMADLPRIFLLWISSFVLPVQFLRYFYIFLCLAAGPLGIYYFLKYWFERESNSFTVLTASFLGAAYYLFNLGTLQLFYVPFEMFTTLYAFLPWLFLFALKYLREGEKKALLVFAGISLFACPMAYAATLFYPYLLALILFLFTYSLVGRNKKKALQRSLAILIITLAINAYWILPNIYSVATQAEIVSNSRINSLFSPEAFLRNKSYGTFSDIAIHKNFLFSWRAFDQEHSVFVDLLDTWNTHLQSKSVLLIGYIMAGISFFGALLSLLKRNKIGLVLAPVVLLSLFFLINMNPPTGVLYAYLYEHIGLFREGFRMPFAKFSTLFVFMASLYFGYFIFKASVFLSKTRVQKTVRFLFIPTVFVALCIFMKPVFDGHLIAPFLKTNIPTEYFHVFDWLNEHENERIAKLPIYTPFNWEFHDWGYEGSGWFSWFGMANPQFDRDFDRWSPYNESFYNEAAFAIYSDDLIAFEKTLEKYQVGYLFLDESILNAGGSEPILRINEIKEMIAESSHIQVAKEFGFLSIYETDFVQNDNYLSTPASYSLIDSDTTYSEKDVVYLENGVYVEDKNGVTYPFANFDKRAEVEIEVEGNLVNFFSKTLDFTGTKELAIENIDSIVDIELDNKKRVKASIVIDGETEEDFSLERGFDTGYNCDLNKIGTVSKENDGERVTYKAFDGGVSCDFFSFPDLSYSQGYLLRITGKNTEGRSLKFYLQNTDTVRMDLEELLPEGEFDEAFVILPKDIEGSGYTLNLETRSFGRVSSENILEKIEFIPVPISILQKIKLEPVSYSSAANDIVIVDSRKTGTGYYSLKTNSKEGLIILGQGYESGWLGFGFKEENISLFNKVLPWFNGEYLRHVKANSWANGWYVSGDHQRLVIVFWPQYLEYLGLAILVISLVFLLNKKGKTHLTVDKGRSLKLK